ncbi:MAG: DUF4926 domain-containing protein [Saprospiraceae bacterium]|nr:DUF4926 domain-containing protein [Saprospiraceae bacterium]
MQLPLYSLVSLLVDIPKHNLRTGDIATIVEYLQPNGNLPAGYVCEASNAIGETIAVFSIRAEQVSPLHRNEVLHVRALAIA